MELKQNFYDEINEKEEIWIELLDLNLLNVYYLPILKKFYYETQLKLNHEYELTLNPIIRSMIHLLDNIMIKIDCIIEEDKSGIPVNITDLKNYFLINRLSNNISNDEKGIIVDNNGMYRLRKKYDSEGLEEYTDDDFYYENQKVA